jgi:glycerol kinase
LPIGGTQTGRETTIVWNRKTGQPIHNAIVWQDRRTAQTCAQLRADGVEPPVHAKDRAAAGFQHATDYSNASRTLLFNIHTHRWDDELLALLDIPRSLLPEVHASSA